VNQIALTNTFIEAMAKLGSLDAKRTAAFLDKLMFDPESAAMDADLVHETDDRSARSMHVSQDLRAIAQYAPNQTELVFVGHREDAYEWARGHCFAGESVYIGRRISVEEMPGEPALGLIGSAPSGAWHCSLYTHQQLCQALERGGIEHGLYA
jgi:hypothetical protein